ncbi:MAG: hypothetical protein Q8920_10520 [Bacillota bacterium]|nr:hypothetical protein [Bacillota bacterium]
MISLYDVFSFAGAFFIFFSIVGIVLYILFSIGLYKIVKDRKMENEWLAYVPIAQLYILGKVIRKVKIFGSEIEYSEIILPVSLLVALILGGIPLLGLILGIGFMAFFYICIYKLFRMYKEKDEAKTMLIVSIVSIVLMGFMLPVFMLYLGNTGPVQKELK